MEEGNIQLQAVFGLLERGRAFIAHTLSFTNAENCVHWGLAGFLVRTVFLVQMT